MEKESVGLILGTGPSLDEVDWGAVQGLPRAAINFAACAWVKDHAYYQTKAHAWAFVTDAPYGMLIADAAPAFWQFVVPTRWRQGGETSLYRPYTQYESMDQEEVRDPHLGRLDGFCGTAAPAGQWMVLQGYTTIVIAGIGDGDGRASCVAHWYDGIGRGPERTSRHLSAYKVINERFLSCLKNIGARRIITIRDWQEAGR